jgi:hypothetical protein
MPLQLLQLLWKRLRQNSGEMCLQFVYSIVWKESGTSDALGLLFAWNQLVG